MYHLRHPKYRPDIDGLRAFAVLSVLGFHAFPFWIKGGFIGVDIFFVISGYLITSIIFNNLDKGTFSFAEFYARRIKRIFPALLIVLVASLVFGWFAMLPSEFKQLGKHVVGGAGFVSNFILWKESGYFDSSAETKPLLHLWSLGVEEQFYIVWPLMLWLARKVRFNLLLVTILVAIVSFYLGVIEVQKDIVAAFYSPQTRFWELMAGSILAWITIYEKDAYAGIKAKINIWLGTVTYRNSSWGNEELLSDILSLAGLLLLIYGLYGIHKNYMFPGAWALVPVLGAVLLIMAGSNAWLNRKVLSNKVMVWIGLISYPLYLWHWVILSFARIIENRVPSVTIRIVAITSSFVLAWLTYLFIESPIRHGKESRAKVISLVALMATVGCLGAVVFYTSVLSETRLSSFENPKILKALNDWEYPNGLKRVISDGHSIYFSGSQNSPEVLLFGDSHMEQYGPRVVEAAKQGKAKNIAFITADGCPPVPDVFVPNRPQCLNFVDKATSFLREHKTIHTVLIGACWNCYFIPGVSNGKYDNYLKKGLYFKKRTKADMFRGGEGREKALREFGKFVKMLSKHYSVFVLMDNPSGKKFDPRTVLGLGQKASRATITFSFSHKFNDSAPTNSFKIDPRQVLLENKMRRLVEESGAVALDQSRIICPKGICSNVDAKMRPIYKDKTHIRPFYIREKMSTIDRVIDK